MTSLKRSFVRRPGMLARLTAQFAGLIFVILALVGVLVYSIVAGSTDEANERALQSAVRIDSPQDAPSDMLVTFWGGPQRPDRAQVPPKLPPGLPDTDAIERVAQTGAEEVGRVTIGGDPFLVLTSPQGDRVVQVALNTHETEEELRRLLAALLASGLVATLVGAGLAALMARRAMRPMAEALAIQRRFIADASHELRTPLTLMSTRAQMLRRSAVAANEDPAGLDELITDANQLTEILEDLLLAAEPRADGELETVELVGVAREIYARFTEYAAERSIVLKLGHVPAHALVRARAAALQRAATALLENALDHAESSVVIEVRYEAKRVLFEVLDDGPGLPVDAEQHLFERFASSRVHNRDSEPRSGRHYGLGLALVSEIAHRFDGGVYAAGAPGGRGARIGVWLPATNTTERAAQ